MKPATLLCLTLSLICLPLAVADTPDASITPFGNVVQNYTLTWSDEFNGTALDTDKWLYRTDSKMWSTQLPANISIADGHLVIALKKEMVNKKKYTGGGVISKQTFEYGYYEARFKVPPGSGWHTSFWTAFYPPAGNTKKPVHTQEIDICEQDSVRTTTYSAGVLAWDQRGKGYGRKYVKTPDLAKDFHVWGCEYTPTMVRFFFDGKLTHETDGKFRHGPQNIWLTCIASQLGGTWGVLDRDLPSTAEFDYVRFFAAPGGGDFGTTTPPDTTTPDATPGTTTAPDATPASTNSPAATAPATNAPATP